MKEKVLNAFMSHGFSLDDLGELGYGFRYEGIRYLWLANVDSDLFSICIPAVLDKDNEHELSFYQVMDKINASLKFVKANEVGESMWLFYEREMLDNEDFENLIPRIILHLEHAYHIVCDADSNNQSESNEEEVLTDEVTIHNNIYELPD